MSTLAGVVGFPVAHSRSPQMHEAAYRALGLDWRYVKLAVPPARFVDTVGALPGSGYRGVNVTIPHKVAALQLADASTAAAAAIGAANTLTFADGVEADNTDAGGLIDALPAGRRSAEGARALVLGAGGAARAVVWALRESGASEVSVWNRTPERARALARELDVHRVGRPGPADLLVNATAVGLDVALKEADVLELLGLSGLAPAAIVVDLVYGDGPTHLARWAERGGAAVVDGIDVLVCQGARSFERWTGHAAPISVMREAARALPQSRIGDSPFRP